MTQQRNASQSGELAKAISRGTLWSLAGAGSFERGEQYHSTLPADVSGGLRAKALRVLARHSEFDGPSGPESRFCGLSCGHSRRA